jgi:hypothetical protein
VSFGDIGAQFVGCDAAGVAVWAGGVEGEAGACAYAALASISAQEAAKSGFMVMQENAADRTVVPFVMPGLVPGIHVFCRCR